MLDSLEGRPEVEIRPKGLYWGELNICRREEKDAGKRRERSWAMGPPRGKQSEPAPSQVSPAGAEFSSLQSHELDAVHPREER